MVEVVEVELVEGVEVLVSAERNHHHSAIKKRSASEETTVTSAFLGEREEKRQRVEAANGLLFLTKIPSLIHQVSDHERPNNPSKELTQYDKLWLQKYQLLVEYKQQHGHTRVPSHYLTPDGQTLGNWVGKQRNSYRDKSLKGYRIDKLNELGFDWPDEEHYQDYDTRWSEKYALLVDYKKEHGHTRVPRHYTVNGHKLGVWVTKQRQHHRQKDVNIKPHRIERLEAIGFEWEIPKGSSPRLGPIKPTKSMDSDVGSLKSLHYEFSNGLLAAS